MCDQSRGQGGYGSSMGFQPQQMQNPRPFYPNTQNKTLNTGMQYGMQRLREMPGFQSGSPGQFGAAGSQGVKFAPNLNNPFAFGDAMQPWAPADPNVPPQMMDRGNRNLASPYQEPTAMPINGQFSTRPQMSSEFSVQQAEPSAAYVGQTMSPPAQSQPTQAQTLINQANQAVMGPFGNTYNRPGDPRGGYFQGGQYTPNVGNAMTGLDNLARWGLGPDGQPLQRGPFLR